MALSFDHSLVPVYGAPVALSPLVTRLLAPNPSPLTFRGTGVYLVGAGADVAVIDPGPVIPDHLAALKAAIGGRRVSHILITHAHADHSPAAAPLKDWCGAPILAMSARSPDAPISAPGTEPADRAFTPDRLIGDGDRITGDGFTLEAVHTPGHTADHLCFALLEEQALFSGDHVMSWSTSVVAPPDGDMGAYLASLDKLSARGETLFYPTHGSPITDAKPWMAALAAHARARADQVLAALRDGPATPQTLAARLYPDLDPKLARAAMAQVQAHLDHQLAQGRIARADDVSSYRLSP